MDAARLRKPWSAVAAITMLVVAATTVLLVTSSAVQANQLADKQWADLQERGTLRIGIDPGWYPYSFYDVHGWQGLDADLMREVARRMHLNVQEAPVGYDALYDSLTLWQTDAIISAVVVEQARWVDFRYSHSYFDAGVRLVVRKDSQVKAISDLSGQTVLTVLGTDADKVARRYVRRTPQMRRVTVESVDDALPKLLSGEVAALLLDATTALKVSADSDSLRLHSVESINYAIALRSDNPRLLHALNVVLDEMRADGTIERLVHMWTR